MTKKILACVCAAALIPAALLIAQLKAPEPDAVAEPMHIVVEFPYDPADPDHDYHADGYYLQEETENWTEEDWEKYFEKYPDEYDIYRGSGSSDEGDYDPDAWLSEPTEGTVQIAEFEY